MKLTKTMCIFLCLLLGAGSVLAGDLYLTDPGGLGVNVNPSGLSLHEEVGNYSVAGFNSHPESLVIDFESSAYVVGENVRKITLNEAASTVDLVIDTPYVNQFAARISSDFSPVSGSNTAMYRISDIDAEGTRGWAEIVFDYDIYGVGFSVNRLQQAAVIQLFDGDDLQIGSDYALASNDSGSGNSFFGYYDSVAGISKVRFTTESRTYFSIDDLVVIAVGGDVNDVDAPAPSPMTWESEPDALGPYRITMTASEANDVSGVEYYFDETSGNIGGSDSVWQTGRTYTDDGLEPNTIYTYRVKARDKSPNRNETSYSLSASATTELAPAVSLRKGPYLIYPDGNSMMVLWQLYDGGVSCNLKWGKDANYADGDVSVIAYGVDHQYSYTIENLDPGLKYYYVVEAGGSNYAGSFYSAPTPGTENLKFMVYGDTRWDPVWQPGDVGTYDHDLVNQAMISTYLADPAYQTITLFGGDWVNNGAIEGDWDEEFFPRNRYNIVDFQANMPINGCKGNHDYGTLFYKYWPYPYYVTSHYGSFDYGPIHVAVVDQYVDFSQGSAQYIWLENDLANSSKEWKFIFLHEPGWSCGGHADNLTVQTDIQPLCLTYGVDIVLAGHNHYYARADVNGIMHITTGGGGAPGGDPPYPDAENIVASAGGLHFCKIDIQGNVLNFVVETIDGTILDLFTIFHGCGLPGDLDFDDDVDYADFAIFARYWLVGTD